MQSLNTIHPSRPTRSFLTSRRSIHSTRSIRSIFSLTLTSLLLIPTPYTDRYQMQSAAVAAPAQLNLNPLIDALQARYGRMQGLAADFSQVYIGADGRRAIESGRLILKRPGKARWEYAQPERKLFVSDGRNIYFYVYGERQASQASVKESADPQIPFLFLLGRGNLRRDFSRIEVAPNERPISAGNVVLLLVPKRAPAEFKQLLAEVSPATAAVQRLVIFERNGARMDFTLSNVRENFIAPDSEFRFTPPAGVTIRKAD